VNHPLCISGIDEKKPKSKVIPTFNLSIVNDTTVATNEFPIHEKYIVNDPTTQVVGIDLLKIRSEHLNPHRIHKAVAAIRIDGNPIGLIQLQYMVERIRKETFRPFRMVRIGEYMKGHRSGFARQGAYRITMHE